MARKRKVLLRLTLAQSRWLRWAREQGYERGFMRSPTRALTALERLGLIERNPTSSGAGTHWRVTEKGEAIGAAIEEAST